MGGIASTGACHTIADLKFRHFFADLKHFTCVAVAESHVAVETLANSLERREDTFTACFVEHLPYQIGACKCLLNNVLFGEVYHHALGAG